MENIYHKFHIDLNHVMELWNYSYLTTKCNFKETNMMLHNTSSYFSFLFKYTTKGRIQTKKRKKNTHTHACIVYNKCKNGLM